MEKHKPDKHDCKVCKQLFTAKNPNLTMTDDDHTVIKCMASDVDSSDRGQGHDLEGHAEGHDAKVHAEDEAQGRHEDKAIKNKPVPRTRSSLKPRSVAELQYYDGNISDSSEKGQVQCQGTDNAKVKGQNLSPNLATKPPKVKSVKPLGGARTGADCKHSGSKPSSSETNTKSRRKVKPTPRENDSLEKEIQAKIANRSHLQHIIDEAMDHFQKLTSKSANYPIHDKVRESKLNQCDLVQTKNDKTLLDGNPTEMNMNKDLESQENDSYRDEFLSSSKELLSSGELDRTSTPDRLSRLENISPSQRHLISPNSENRISPNGSVSGSRRRLPQPPGHKLRCSVTSLVHSSLDSDSSRPNSSADFSDISECGSVSKGDAANSNTGNVTTKKSTNDNSSSMDKVLVMGAKAASSTESHKSKNIDDVTDTINLDFCDVRKDDKADKHENIHPSTRKQTDNHRTIGGKSVGRVSKNDIVDGDKDGIKINVQDIGSNELDSRVETPNNKLTDNMDLLDTSAASSSDVSTSESVNNSDSLSAIDRSNSESGKENQLIPLKQKHVSRSPSYRKKVMAKARSRYHRQLKELKCKTGECNGNCSLCGSQNSETVPRSQTSLGLPVESISEEQYLEQSSPRRAYTPEPSTTPLARSPSSGQRSMKRVPISSRVDVLMSNNLFKKHLSKHEDLLQRHTLLYRKFGLQKAVSNLDLSQNLLFDDISTSESLHDGENPEETMLNSSLKLTSSKHKHTSRRYSLTGETDLNDFNNVQGLNDGNEEDDKRTPKLGAANSAIPSLEEYRASLRHRQTQAPSFAEFRNRSQKRRILPSNKIIESLENNSSQNTRKDNQNESANAITGNDKSIVGQEGEVSEITVSIGHLDTIVESSLQTTEPEAAISKHVQKLENKHVQKSENRHVQKSENKHVQKAENKNSEKDGSVIKNRNDNVLNDKLSVLDASEGNKNVESNSDELKSSLGIKEKLDTIIVRDSLSADDRSPLSTLSTSELDSAEINPPRRIHSETDSVCSEDISYSDLSSSEVTNIKSASKERYRKGAKRPRSLISKKSSLVSLIKESQQKEQTAAQIANRQTVKRGNSSSSFLKDGDKHTDQDGTEKERADSFRSVKSEGHGRRKHDVNDEIRALQRKAEESLGLAKGNLSTGIEGGHSVSTKGSHSTGMEGGNTVRFSLEHDVQSEASQEMRGTESEAASLPESVASESHLSEVSGLHEDDRAVFSETFEFDVQEDDMLALSKSSKDDTNAPVFRSTSDACDATPEALKKRRERKERPYKSDPFSGTEIIPASKRYYIREERARLGQHKSFANSSREEILDFLDVMSSEGKVPPADSFPSLEELNEDEEQNLSVSDVTTDHTKKNRNVTRSASSASTDSGVIGQEESHGSQQSSPSNTLTRNQRASWSEFRHLTGNQPQMSASCSDLSKMDGCLDCSNARKSDNQNNVLQICSRCYQRRVERKKTMQEIIETEVNYGRDLNILKDEFYEPMRKTCLLNKDQLDSIFLNLDELIHVNTYFLGKLRAAINTANHNNDEDLQEVRIGSLFLESSSMFLTFENYCVNQAQAPVLLEQLEREKELLRIFLHVSQNDNHLLRRMHLKSFLMVPVQRIMKYPMLLDRLYKATPSKTDDKESIREAKEKIEDILGHINAKSKVSLTGSIRQNQKRKLSERHCSMTEKIEVLRVALESLGWSRKDVCDVITSRLQLAFPVDHLWAGKKCKNLKFTSALGVLLTLGEPSFEHTDKNLVFPNHSAVRSAAVVLIREKNGKYQIMREPLMLEKCVVSQDPDFTEVFEVLEWSKESLLIKADSQKETNQWVLYLRQQMQQLGCWRKRRNALPNILLNHLSQ